MRNVGHHMYTDAVLDSSGEEIPEGLLDAAITGLIAIHDLKSILGHPQQPRRLGLHRQAEDARPGRSRAHLRDLLARGEACCRLASSQLKVGLMDEERRTSSEPRACIEAMKTIASSSSTPASSTAPATNPHLYGRRGDGAQNDMKSSAWIKAYEDWNVDMGLANGLAGVAQIGKGMWAAPDRMADMVAQKIGHPLAGASTAWVPCPTAATLHALHYHPVDVFARQRELTVVPRRHDRYAHDSGSQSKWAQDICAGDRQQLPGILGYVVRWIDQASAARRCRTLTTRLHGRSRDTAHLRPAYRQLVASRHRHQGSGDGGAEAHGGRRRPAECG